MIQRRWRGEQAAAIYNPPMTILTLALPLARPTLATEFDYVLSSDARTVTDHGTAPLALLPRATSLVLVAPARALSWHRVRLPPVAASRLRAALDGLLEEQLLDEPAQLALALAPRPSANADSLVAVLDRSWLQATLAFFEQGKRPVSRVVPSFAPDPSAPGAPRLHVVGSAHGASLVVVASDDVTCLPLESAAAAFAGRSIPDGAGRVLAEPPVAALAEQLLGRPVEVQAMAQRLLEAARSDWELAQFDLAISGSGRLARRWQQRAGVLWRAPNWQAARWGLAGLLLANLVGLNAWAWQLEAAVRDKQQRVNALLVQTFPGVRTVVDAPVQMQRELALLRQASGSVAKDDLDAMLAGVGALLPAGAHASAIDYASGELALKGLGLAGPQFNALREGLQAQGLSARQDGERLLVRAGVLP